MTVRMWSWCFISS